MARCVPVNYYEESYPSIKALANAKNLDYKALNYQIKSQGSVEKAVDKLLGLYSKIDELVEDSKDTTVGSEQVDECTEVKEGGDEKQVSLYEYIRSPFDISKFGIEDLEIINLIDFENVSDSDFDTLSHANRKNAINIFFYNSCIYSNDFFKFIKKSENMNLQVLTHHCGNNLVDNIILFYLSSLITLYPDKEYVIISEDRAFYEFVDAINRPNVTAVGRLKMLKNRTDRYKYSLFKYILNNNIIMHRNVIKVSELDAIFADFFKNGNKTPDIPGLIKHLTEFKVIERKYLGNLEYYKFDIETMKKFVVTNSTK